MIIWQILSRLEVIAIKNAHHIIPFRQMIHTAPLRAFGITMLHVLTSSYVITYYLFSQTDADFYGT